MKLRSIGKLYDKHWLGKLDFQRTFKQFKKISHEIAKAKTKVEYKKYKELQAEQQRLENFKKLEEDFKNLK